MARFEFSGVPTISPTGAPGNDYQHVVADPAAFGGLIATARGKLGGAEEKLGSGLESVGKAGLDYATARQHLTNEISASETNTWLAKSVTDKFNDFGRLQGRAAQDALPKFKDDVEDLYKKTLENAGDNLQMQAMLAKSGRVLTDRYYQFGTNHADQQWRTWQAKTADDRATEYGNQAALFAQHGTWDDVSMALNTSDDEVRKKFEAQHYDRDTIETEVKKRRGANVKNIVETLAASGDPTTAQAVFDKYKSQMDAASILHVTNNLKNLSAQITGRSDGDELSRHAPHASSSAPVAGVAPSFLNALKREEGFDAKPRWDVKQWTVGYGTRASGPDEKVDDAEAERRFSSAVSGAAKVVDGVNPNLDPGTRAALVSLTFNTGAGWANSGLGEKVRAGDLAGAKQLFVKYGNVDGAPNEAVTARRYREASWFGAAEAPAGGPLATKQQAYESILARTDGDPLRQTAAIARMNQIYSVYHSEAVAASAAFQLKKRDTTTEALLTGTAKTPLTEAEFVANLSPKVGTMGALAEYGEYQKDLRLGADMSALADMPPEQRAALYKRYTPQAGAENYTHAAQRLQQLVKADQDLQQQKKDDPAKFANEKLPAVKAAAQNFFDQVLPDQKASPELRQASARNYAVTTLDEQARIGIPEADRRIVPQSYVDHRTARLNDPKAAGGTLGMVDQLEREAKMWGEYWPQVYRQFGEAGPAVRVIGAGVQPTAGRILSELNGVKLADILKDENAEKASTIKKDVLDAFKPLAASMGGNEGMISVFNDFRGQAEKLAAYYVVRGEPSSSSDAAAKAWKELVGHKYDFLIGRDSMFNGVPNNMSFRMPKSVGLTTTQAVAGVREAAGALETMDLAPMASRTPGVSADYRKRETVRAYQRDGVWVTDPDELGVMLVYHDEAAKKADGKPLIVPWAELGRMGDAAIKRRSDADRRYLELGPMPRG